MDNIYRFFFYVGVLDMDYLDLKLYIILGISRSEAYKSFENLKDSIKKTLSKEQSELLSDPEIKASYDKLFEGNNVALVNNKNIYSLVTDEEFKNERIQMEKEFNYLKTKNK